MWDNLSPEECLKFLVKFSGLPPTYPVVDRKLIDVCESNLNHEQRTAYVDYVSGVVADHTYKRMHPDDPAASTLFYFTMMRVSIEVRSKMLWHAITGNQP